MTREVIVMTQGLAVADAGECSRLPFKLMLFVLVDGWSLVMGSLAGSFLK